MALEIRDYITVLKTHTEESLSMHIGIGTGPVVAGVIGAKKFIYDLWGHSVNMASRLSTEATTGGILVDAATYRRLHTMYQFEGPESLTVKGKRALTSYRLIARQPAVASSETAQV